MPTKRGEVTSACAPLSSLDRRHRARHDSQPSWNGCERVGLSRSSCPAVTGSGPDGVGRQGCTRNIADARPGSGAPYSDRESRLRGAYRPPHSLHLYGQRFPKLTRKPKSTSHGGRSRTWHRTCGRRRYSCIGDWQHVTAGQARSFLRRTRCSPNLIRPAVISLSSPSPDSMVSAQPHRSPRTVVDAHPITLVRLQCRVIRQRQHPCGNNSHSKQRRARDVG